MNAEPDTLDAATRAILHNQPAALVECFIAYQRSVFTINTTQQFQTWFYNRMQEAKAQKVTVGQLLGISDE